MNPNNGRDISDRDLLNECLQGKQQAWETFYERFVRLISSVVRGTAARYLVDLTPEDLMDCEQFIWKSLFEKDFNKLRKWQERCSLATWLKVCSCNAAINYIISVQKRISRQIAFDDPYSMALIAKDHQKADSEKEVTQKEFVTKIMHIIEDYLSERERLFAAYYWFDEYSFEEISEIMHLSKPNLHLLKHRTKKKIKRFLKEAP